MDSDYDIPLDDYGNDNTPYVTIEEMIQLLSLRKKQWDRPQYLELQFDEQSGLFYTEYLMHDGGDLLQEHLLIEQCLEHLDELDWKRITNGYDFDIVSRIEHLVENPLVWVDEIPYELARQFVVTGRVAVEKSSEERSTCSPYSGLSLLFYNERLDWFATQLPTSKDVFAEYAYYSVPKNMILWNLILTDEHEKFFMELHAPEKIDEYTGRPFWPYCNPNHFRREIERIYNKFGAQKAAQIVRLLREDWQDIKVLKLFGSDELTPEQIEEFRQCIFEGMDRSLRIWDAEATEEETSKPNPASAPTKSRGPKVQSLFADVNRNEDTERTRQEAERLKRYIADHHMGNIHLDSNQANQLSRLVACFYYEWTRRGWVSPQPQGAAIHRFLTEQCQLPCDVTPKAYARAIADLIKANHKDYNISDNLRSYFK